MKKQVDFSYAFSTPHRITVGRPTNSNRTLLDLQPGSLQMTWNYIDLTHFPLATYMPPKDHAFTWSVNIIPQIDDEPFTTGKWKRMEEFLPALDNFYDNPNCHMQLKAIGAETATIIKIEVSNTDTVSHQFQLCCEMKMWGVNKAWVDPGRWTADCLFPIYGDRADRILLMGIGADQWTFTADGRAKAAGVLSPIWNLKPGEVRIAWLVRPYKAYEADLPGLRKHNWEHEFDKAREEWHDLINRICRVSIPDQDVVNAFHACFADLFIMREPVAEGYIAGVPGTHMYRAVEPCEPSIALVAMDQFGLHYESAEGQRIFLETQGDDGEWADPHGWGTTMWLMSGIKAWAAMEHYRLTRDKDYLADVYPRMLANSRWQEKRRAGTRLMSGNERPLTYGLMPRGKGDCGLLDDGDKYGVFIPHNIWAVYADRISLEAAEILGKTYDVEELRKIYQTAYDDLLATMEQGAIKEEDYRWIPCVAGKTSGSRWGVLNALFPCRLLSPSHELITGTLRYIEKNISKGGIPIHTGWMQDGMWVAMALDNVAEAHLARGNGDAAAHYLYATLNHGTPLYTWCEERGQEPDTKEISGDLQHLWTPVAVVRIIRDILVMEGGDGLNLAMGTPRDWLASGKSIGITKAPTYYGPITYQMQYNQAASTVIGEVELTHDSDAVWVALHIRLPDGLKVVSVNPESKATILPDGSGLLWKMPRGSLKFHALIGT